MSENDIRRDFADAKPFDSAQGRQFASTRNRARTPSVELLPATAFKVEPIHWNWPGWLARGKFHLLAGAPGTGKTTIALSLCSAITTGGRLPDGALAPTGDVLIWSGEDGVEDTLVPRLLADSADISRIHFVSGRRKDGKLRPFDPPTDMPALAEAAECLTNLQLLILDSVVSAVTGDSHKNTETRRGLQPVVDLAERLHIAVLGLTHLAKGSSGREPLERVIGSVAFGAVARVVMITVRPADFRAPRRLVRAKSNLGPDGGGIEYTLMSAPVTGYDLYAQRADWGATLEGSARELMAVEEPEATSRTVGDAARFLVETLREGPVSASELKDAAVANGHTWKTVSRAKKVLGIRPDKTGFQGTWVWQLPQDQRRPT